MSLPFQILKEIFSSPLDKTYLIKKGKNSYVMKPKAKLANKDLSDIDIPKANLKKANCNG